MWIHRHAGPPWHPRRRLRRPPRRHRVDSSSIQPLDVDQAIVETTAAPESEDELREWFDQLENRDDVVYLVAERDELVGFAQFCWGDAADEAFLDEGDVLLHSLYVHPGDWGDDVGTALLEHGLERLPEHAGRLVLGVLPENDVGWSFYESRGFENIAKSGYEVAGAVYETDVLARNL